MIKDEKNLHKYMTILEKVRNITKNNNSELKYEKISKS